MNSRRLAQALFRDGCARRWLPSFLRPAIFPFNLADSDHIMAVPDFSSFLFHDHMFGVSGKGQDRFMVLPIDNCDSGPVGISRWLNAARADKQDAVMPFISKTPKPPTSALIDVKTTA